MVDEDPFARFENDPEGEEGVRKKLAGGLYGEQAKPAAERWLRLQEQERILVEMKRSADADERAAEAAERASAHAKASADAARRSSSWARWVGIGTLVAAAVAVVSLIRG
ncbi:MAG: hypothetical protein RIC87_15505 [Kiloniellales bacterium]